MSIAFIDFGCSHFLGGSGFVSVYVTGVCMTNAHYRNPEINHTSIQEVLLPFNTMTEISIFLLFGLLVNPMDLTPNLVLGVGAALLLMLAGSVNYNLSLGFVLTFLLGSMCITAVFYTYRNLADLVVSAGRSSPVCP